MKSGSGKAVGTRSKIGFADFWLMVSKELGHARLYLNNTAKNLEDFISIQSDVRAYLHQAIRDTYKLSACQNLGSPISIESVLDTLGESAFALQKQSAGDLFDIELLEEIAWLICDRYPDHVTDLVTHSALWVHEGQEKNSQELQDDAKGQVISFPDYKIRKANANL